MFIQFPDRHCLSAQSPDKRHFQTDTVCQLSLQTSVMGEPPHVTVSWWLDADHQKGENLAFGFETIVYQLPLANRFKRQIIQVLHRFKKEMACKLTLRGHKGYDKRRKLDDTSGEAPPIQRIMLSMTGIGKDLSAEERVACLRSAECTVDSFIRTMTSASPEEVVYMLPPDDGSEVSDVVKRAKRRGTEWSLIGAHIYIYV